MSVNESKTELSGKQMTAIAALISEPTTKAAAEKAKIAEGTIHRWLNDPAFFAALKESRERVFEATLAALQGGSGKAVKTLCDVMDDATAPAAARVSAAKTVLDLALRARDQLELSERLKAMEEQLAMIGGGK
jgi:hypothetical protein